jgi:hypothetical protein
MILVLVSISGLLLACGVTWKRIQWESGYQDVGLMVPLAHVALLARQENIALDKALKKFNESKISIFSLTSQEISDWQTTLLRPAPWSLDEFRKPTSYFFTIEDLKKLREANFDLALIIALDDFAKPDSLSLVLAELERLQIKKLYLEGGALSQKNIELLGEWLKRNNSQWGTLEFAEPASARQLYLANGFDYARVHRIKDTEMIELSRSEAIERWERAVSERNMRLLDLHLWPTSLSDNLSYLASIQNRLVDAGFTVGWPRPIESLNLPNSKLIAVCLAIAFLAFTLWVISLKWSLFFSTSQLILILFGCSLIIFTVITVRDSFFIRSFALLMAIMIPILIYLLVRDWIDRCQNSLWKAAVLVTLISLGSCAGSFVMAALMTRETYLLKLDEFQGVKLSMILPLGTIFILELMRSGWEGFKAFWLRPLRLIDVLAVSAGSILLIIILLRSGNFSIIPIPESEQSLRSSLENWLLVRPRFKEFAIGHPLLMALIALGRQRLGFYAPFVLVGAWVGQISIINTFAHLHTPWILSFWRTTNGMFVGIFVGLIAYLLILGVLRSWKKWQPRAS